MTEVPQTDIDLKTLEGLIKDTAVGDTMYEKKWVIENILEVGKHFQTTPYLVEDKVVELDSKIEDLLCTLWDISVERDVSMFYIEHGVLDIFVELFLNPNVRVKEISVGVMSNMVAHMEVFNKVLEKQAYLSKCLGLLEEKDSPTLSLVLRCLHSYGYNLFTLLQEQSEPQPREESVKEELKQKVNTWLIFLGSERVVHNLGVIIASCTHKEVLSNGSRLVSVIASLWDFSEERRKISQYFGENNFLLCTIEGIHESIGEDKTVKHFLVFLHTIYENNTDKDVVGELSQKIVDLVTVLLSDHVLEYSKVEDSDLEFIFNIAFILKSSLASGGFDKIGRSLPENLADLISMVEGGDLSDSDNKSSILTLLENCDQIMAAFREVQTNGGYDSSENTPRSSESR